jgi:phospholipid N-methyltransferase
MNNSQEVLQACTVEGTIVKLPADQLDRKVYLDTKKKLEHIGGKWKGGKTFGFVFDHDPTELLEQIANGEDRNLKKETQFFPTPKEVIDLMLSKVSIFAHTCVLEPSAGRGAIVDVLLSEEHFPIGNVTMVEKDPLHRIYLKQQIDEAWNTKAKLEDCTDFLEYDIPEFISVILANPPFNKNQDIDHILKMYDGLHHGTIVTLASKHWELSDNKKERFFRKWLKVVGAEVTPIDQGAFKESGTMIATNLIVIKK